MSMDLEGFVKSVKDHLLGRSCFSIGKFVQHTGSLCPTICGLFLLMDSYDILKGVILI